MALRCSLAIATADTVLVLLSDHITYYITCGITRWLYVSARAGLMGAPLDVAETDVQPQPAAVWVMGVRARRSSSRAGKALEG
eukprot:1967286-Amphidinium_carterae.1